MYVINYFKILTVDAVYMVAWWSRPQQFIHHHFLFLNCFGGILGSYLLYFPHLKEYYEINEAHPQDLFSHHADLFKEMHFRSWN